MAEKDDGKTFVLSAAAVSWGIETLRSQPIHSFFIAYLMIRQQGSRQGTADVEPSWSTLNDYLDVPGGPPGKPWFRPFWDQARNAGQDWMRRHPAGSWNTSSVRPETPGARVLDMEGKAYVLTDGHWDRAVEHLLHGERVPVVALSAFFYRNFGFTSDEPSIGPTDLIEEFRSDFGYQPGSDDVEFDALYSVSIPDRTDWFEPFSGLPEASDTP